MGVTAAELKTKQRNALSDGDFAIPRLRKLPLNDARHVRDALARYNQVQGATDEEKAAAKRKIKAAAKKYGVEVSDDFAEYEIYGKPLLVACGEHAVAAEVFAEGKPLPYVRIGEHDFRGSYGLVTITGGDLDHLVENFKRNARRQDLPLLNEEHIPATYSDAGEVLMGPGAIGWIKDLYREGDTVYMIPDWNPAGEELLAQDRYRAVSPELLLDWTDPETGERWGLTAAGAALTTAPRMKNLAHPAPLAAAEARVLAFAESARFAYAADVHVDQAMPNFSVAYAFPDRHRLPLHTAEAVKGARARFLTVEANEEERDQAWGRLREAAGQHGVAVPPDWRSLKASESVALLMQEGDDLDEDLAAGMLAPCSYQPPYGGCPGYTRSDPDNDGDADCCALAGRGCNGYIPLMSRATFVSPNAPSFYSDRRGGGPMDPKNDQRSGAGTAATGNTPAVNADAEGANDQAQGQGTGAVQGTAAGAQPAATTGTTSAAAVTAPAGQQAAAGATAPAAEELQHASDFAEVNRILAAERSARQAAETKAAEALEEARRANKSVVDMQTATRLAEVSRRVEALVESGRITPKERDVYAQQMAQFAEHDWMLTALEEREANSAVDMRERGSGSTEEPDANGSAVAHKAALALMAERGQQVDPKSKGFYQNYRLALSEYSAREARKNHLGYQG